MSSIITAISLVFRIMAVSFICDDNGIGIGLHPYVITYHADKQVLADLLKKLFPSKNVYVIMLILFADTIFGGNNVPDP